MQLPIIRYIAALSALALTVCAVPQAAQTVTQTVTVTSTNTAAGATACNKASGGYNQHVCDSPSSMNRCLGLQWISSDQSLGQRTTLGTDTSKWQQTYMYYGEFRNSWDSRSWHVAEPVYGGAMNASYQDFGNQVQARCYFQNAANNAFNCFNANGQQFLWYYNNTDLSVGLGLTIPQGTTQWQAYWLGASQ